MKLWRMIFFLGMFLLCSCSGPSSGLNESIAVMVRNDSDIERIYSKLQSVKAQADGKNYFENKEYKFEDRECSLYEAKNDMIKNQRKRYREIDFYNLRTDEQNSCRSFFTKQKVFL